MTPPVNYYPAIDCYDQRLLDVGDGHLIYVEQSGNPNGIPALFVHGGPGGGTNPAQRRYFDPNRYRIILFDQRGCGRSTPHASLEHNTTWHLVADMERIRQTLDIERWLVFGGSWGSTLSLAYAQTHPEQVTGLILRGIFLLRPQEIQWFYQDGCSALFPDAWEDYLQPIPPTEQYDLVQAYHQRLTGKDAAIRQQAARAWSCWEAATSKLIPDQNLINWFSQDEFSEALARIECHYFVNSGFFEHPDQLLRNIDRIRHIPGTIVQGRYDVVCPMQTAWDLHQAWPEAAFHIVDHAGHAATEPGIVEQLIAATDAFAAQH